MTTTMRAAVLHPEASSLQIEQVGVAGPGPEEVLVRTAATGLCHSDLHFIGGSWPTPTPCVLGHEAAGVVEAVGAGVGDFAPGDHVVTCLSVGCGECNICGGGRSYLCTDGHSLRTRPAGQPPRLSLDGRELHQFVGLATFAECMLVHRRALVRIRTDMPLDRAALLGCGVLTGTGAVFRTAGVRPGSSVAVVGCGGVGMAAVQAARIAGATMVIAVDTEPRKLAWATELGATHTVDPADGDPVEQVRSLTGGGAEFTFEAIGLPRTVEQSFAMAARGGSATVIGMLPQGSRVEIDGTDLLLQEKRLQGSLMGSNVFRRDLPQLVDLYLDGRLRLDEMVSLRLDLERINEGYEAMLAGEIVRSVVEFP